MLKIWKDCSMAVGLPSLQLIKIYRKMSSDGRKREADEESEDGEALEEGSDDESSLVWFYAI